MWIAQELLLASTPIIIFNELELPFDHLAHLIQELNIPCGLPSTSLSMDYIRWRNLRTWTHPTSLSLTSLLQHFSAAECFDERDRVYALLSIASDGYRINPDYAVSKMTLFRAILAGFIPGNTMDNILNLGATLIETLQIVPPNSPESLFKEDHKGLDIPLNADTMVGSPVWSYAALRTMSTDGQPAPLETYSACIYVPILDGEDVHVFEYATEVAIAGKTISVLYGRTHEYLHGRPQIPGVPLKPFWVLHCCGCTMRASRYTTTLM